MGLAKRPSRVLLNGEALHAERYWTHAEEKGMLVLQDLKDRFPEGAWAREWEIKWE